MRRTAATAVLLAVTTVLAACGGDLSVNFDKNGKEKACSALDAVSTEVESFSGSTTVGDARTKLAEVESKLTAATDTTTGFTASVLAPLTKAIDAVEAKLAGPADDTPLSEVAGAEQAVAGIDKAYASLTKLFKCA